VVQKILSDYQVISKAYRIVLKPANESSGADSMGHGGTCLHCYKWMGTGAQWVEKQPTRNNQTVLTITKALTKTTLELCF